MTRFRSRRAVLHLAGVATVPFAGCSISGSSENARPLTELYDADSIAYEHDQLELSGLGQPVALGEHIAFTISNTSTASVSLGCHNPWTLQQPANGHWRDLLCTSARGVPNCATMLSAGESQTA